MTLFAVLFEDDGHNAAAIRKAYLQRHFAFLEANAETAPRPDDPGSKDRTAARILQAGVDKDAEAAGRIARSRKDPRID